jgi:hypothetical protein
MSVDGKSTMAVGRCPHCGTINSAYFVKASNTERIGAMVIEGLEVTVERLHAVNVQACEHSQLPTWEDEDA